MTIVKQLLREYWLPTCLAIGWTVFNFWGVAEDGASLASKINVFGPTFFLCSWMTGQFFRVKKQARVEGALSSIEERADRVITDLEAVSTRIMNQMTGGDSYCRCTIEITAQREDILVFWVVHEGEYPLHDLTARIVDVDRFRTLPWPPTIDTVRDADTIVNLNTLNPNQAIRIEGAEFSLAGFDERSFNVFFTARNGSFTHSIRLRRNDGEWLSGQTVSRGHETLWSDDPHGLLTTEADNDIAGGA